MTVVGTPSLAPTAASAAPQPATPGAKVRILDTANRLFYDEGIRAVGIDRLISESAVTKATFYKHYGSKDTLIVEYLAARHETARKYVTEDLPDDAERAIRTLIGTIIAEVQGPRFRGCPFINAAAEFSDPTHPVRDLVQSHRDWYTDTLSELMRRLGHPMPGDAADDLVLARDGAMTGGYAGDEISAAAALQRAVDRLIADATR